MLVRLPFSGFYYSQHSETIDYAIEMAAQDDHGGILEGIADILYDNIDYKALHECYCKKYCDELAHEFDIEVKFIELESPKYYNYETDSLFADIPLKNLRQIWKDTDRAAFKAFILERCTTRSGFMSHYPSNLADWPKDLRKWDHNHFYYLLNFNKIEIDYLENIHEWVWEYIPQSTREAVNIAYNRSNIK